MDVMKRRELCKFINSEIFENFQDFSIFETYFSPNKEVGNVKKMFIADKF